MDVRDQERSATSDPLEALQSVTDAPVPGDIAAVASRILAAQQNFPAAVESALEVLTHEDEIDRVTVVATDLAVPPGEGWLQVGERMWLLEWNRPGRSASPTLTHPDQAQPLRLPWLSQLGRRDGVAAVWDVDRLGGPAAGEAQQLREQGIAALLAQTMVAGDAMVGSLGLSRSTPGRWSPTLIAGVRLLGSALGARLTADRTRGALAVALRRGDQARQSQQQFFSALGHELRTPLAAIMGTAEMLTEGAIEMIGPPSPTSAPGVDVAELIRAGHIDPAVAAPVAVSATNPAGDLDLADFAGGSPADEDVAEFATGVISDAAVIIRASDQLLAVVEALLQTGQELGVGVDSQPVDVATAAADVTNWLVASAHRAQVTVSSTIPAGTTVASTPSGLRQILTNLVENAISYNHPGGRVEMTVDRSLDGSGSPRIRIGVRDTGPGLTLEQQSEVFRPFVRFAAPESPGTGLGLALSRSLAERDGGLMGVESVVGRGSVFWVDLPDAAQPPAHEVPADGTSAD